MEEAHLVSHVAGEGHLVGRQDHGHALVRELGHHLEHLVHQLGVERAGDLVEEQELRAHRHRPHDRDPLLLAAREPVGVGVGLLGEPDALEQPTRPLVGVGLGQLEDLAGPEGHVVEDRHVGEQVVGLEHDPHVAAQPVQLDVVLEHRAPVDPDRSRVHRLEAVDAAQQRRLARAGRADERDDLVGVDVEVHAGENGVVTEPLHDPAGLDERHQPADAWRRFWSRLTR